MIIMEAEKTIKETGINYQKCGRWIFAGSILGIIIIVGIIKRLVILVAGVLS